MATRAPGYQQEDSPWWFSLADLRELDKLIEREIELIRNGREQPLLRSVEVTLPEGYSLAESSFEAILREHAMQLRNTTPTDFSVRFAGGGISGQVSCSSHGTLTIGASPAAAPEAFKLYSALMTWAQERRFRAPERTLVRAGGAIGIIGLFVWGWLVLTLSLQRVAAVSPYLKEAHAILSQGGVNAANERRAIEIVLALQSNYGVIPADTVFRSPSLWQWFLGAVLLLVAAYGGLAPERLIGIGKGERQLKRWTALRKALFITIPLLFAGAMVGAVLKRMLGW